MIADQRNSNNTVDWRNVGAVVTPQGTHGIRPNEHWSAAMHRIYGPQQLIKMLEMRMRWAHGQKFGFSGLLLHQDAERVVVVVVITGRPPVIIEDGAELFPSDTLITQLRLLETV
jgi:hypothetical protein